MVCMCVSFTGWILKDEATQVSKSWYVMWGKHKSRRAPEVFPWISGWIVVLFTETEGNGSGVGIWVGVMDGRTDMFSSYL